MQTHFEVPDWAVSPDVTGVPADLEGRWERIDDPQSKTEVLVQDDALQKVGRNPMNRYDLLRAFGLPSNAPLEIYVNHFGGETGVLAIAWDHLDQGGSMLQYAIQAVVDAQGDMWLAFTKNERTSVQAELTRDSWFWRCRRLP